MEAIYPQYPQNGPSPPMPPMYPSYSMGSVGYPYSAYPMSYGFSVYGGSAQYVSSVNGAGLSTSTYPNYSTATTLPSYSTSNLQQMSLNAQAFFGVFGGLSMGPEGNVNTLAFSGRQYYNPYGGGYPGAYPGAYPQYGYPGYGYNGISAYSQPCSCDSSCASRDNNVCCADVDNC